MRTTFLTEDQIWGNNALDVIKKYGIKTGLTDLAIALEGCIGRGNTTSEGERPDTSGRRPLMMVGMFAW